MITVVVRITTDHFYSVRLQRTMILDSIGAKKYLLTVVGTKKSFGWKVRSSATITLGDGSGGGIKIQKKRR
jgi:hypothetical protein